MLEREQVGQISNLLQGWTHFQEGFGILIK